MAGPGSGGGFGGGSRGGGGFSGGGGFGGGSRGGFGGGFGGPRGGFHHHGGFYHRPRMHFYTPFFGRRRYYGGGGCLSSIMSIGIVLLVIVMMLSTTLVSAIKTIANGGSVEYNEEKFQSYVKAEYNAAFGASEDALMLVFLTEESADGYYAISWMGDNLKLKVREAFSGESSAFGRTVRQYINSTYYANSLSSNLADVMDVMTDYVNGLGLKSNFNEPVTKEYDDSHIINYTNFSITDHTVNRALEDFTDATGIPCVIIVEDMEKVFGKTIFTSDVKILLFMLVVVIFIAISVIQNSRKRNNTNNNQNNNYNNYNSDFQ